MSDQAFRSETVDTIAGAYTIELFYDEDATNPLTDYEHPGLAWLVSSIHGAMHDTMDDAEAAGDILRQLRIHQGFDEQQSQRRYDKWRAITDNPWVLVTGSGQGSTQSHWWNWSVLVDTTQSWIESDPTKVATSLMDVYERWARGEFCGSVITDPDGTEVDSLWGIDDDDYAMSEARDNVAWHAKTRQEVMDDDRRERERQANLVGAGFVGLI